MNTSTRPDLNGSASELAQKAAKLSRFARCLLQNEPELGIELLEKLHQPFDDREMEMVLDGATITGEAALAAALRGLRKKVMLRLLARDLGGLAGLDEVMATTSKLAELAIRFSLNHLSAWMHERYGEPIGGESKTAQRLIVVGMGKLGGGELNVSSDVDLIFVYPEEGETSGTHPISNHEFFTRLGRKLISTLNAITSQGYVFRVDMRLRPYGESGPLAVSFSMLENYFLSQGREWERYAWIKGRAITGERVDELEKLVGPFVFRKYLDFGAFASMREMHAQIHREVKRREMHDNIKLGPGGIREIEFIAQVFQLIRGGRDAGLRIRPTLAVLQRLAERRLLPPEAVAELCEAYVFLRNLEHRLQYLDDQQTQSLPKGRDDHAAIAEAMGFATYTAFLKQLVAHRAKVTLHFERILAVPKGHRERHPLALLWQGGDGEAVEQLADLGYQHPSEILNRLRQISEGSRYRQLPAASQARFDALIPQLIEIAPRFANPDETLERLLQLLEAVSRRGAYLALLLEYPHALEALAKLASTSRWACDYLTGHPILLDEFLDARVLYGAPDWRELKSDLERHLNDAGRDLERQMDILRHFRHSQTFRLLAQDLAGLLPLTILSDHLSDLADLILGETLRLCWDGLRVKHRDDLCFAVIGYGKLGGKELGYVSDLDIIFLYDDPAPEAQEVYAKLAQRINHWLASLTPAGVLYETDLRLRPDGASGLLVSSIEAFEEYQKKKAWVWEHQALTRARFAAGDARVGEKFEHVRTAILCRQRDIGPLREEIAAMRDKMRAAHPNKSALFDVKHDRGGIVDVEFIVQLLVLAHAHSHPELVRNIGNLALLKVAGEIGLIPQDLAQPVRNAYRQYRRWQHQLRLQGAQYARVEPERASKYIVSVVKLWETVFAGVNG